MEINPIPENEVGYQATPDNGLTPEQQALIDEQVQLGDEIVKDLTTEQPAEPSTEGVVKPESTPSAVDTSQPEPEQPEEPEEQEGGFANLPNYLDNLDMDDDGERDLPASTRAGLAMGFGFTDAAADLLNWGMSTALRGLEPPFKVPKFNAYEDQFMQLSRNYGSFAMPQVGISGVASKAIKGTKAGQALSRTPLGRFGIEATSDVASAYAVTEFSENVYQRGNTGNMIQDQTLVPIPGFMDGMIENWAIQPGDSPEKVKEKNRSEEFAMALVGPMLGYALDAAGTIKSVKPIEITGNTALSKQWMEANAPRPVEINEDVVLSAKIKQDEALAEVGEYNRYLNNNDPDVPLRGVDDVYDYQELGVRTVDDFGVVGASVDAAQIAANKGTTYGRIRNMISTPALNYALREPTATNDVVLGLAKTLKDADQYVATGPGWKVDFNEIIKAGDNLVVDMIDPSMDSRALKEMLEPYIFKNEDGVEILRENGYAFVLGATRKMIEDYTGMDVARAQAYLVHSLAGQASDISEGLRLNAGGAGVKYAQQKLRDNLSMLLKLKATTNYYKNQKVGLINAFKRMKNINKTDAQVLKENFPIFQENLNREIGQFGRDMDFIYKEYPELGEALAELVEQTDGRVFTIDALNETMANSFKNFRPLFDANPDTPNLIGSAIRGNVLNSMLSSIETPLKALYGNIAGTVFEPVNMMAGAALRGDVKSMQDYWMAYTAFGDTMSKSMDMAGRMFTKAAQNDPRLTSATDIDFSIKQDQKLDAMRKVAETEAARGNTGYLKMVEFYENLIQMSRHPAMRFSSNLMTGMDGMTQATFANAEARFRAMDLMRQTDGNVDPKELAQIANQEYNKMFDENGILIDKAAQYQADEIALRLDNPMAAALRSGSKNFPILNVLFPFKGTMTNIVKQFDDVAPVPYSRFQKDINELLYHNTEWFQNNPIKVRKLLTDRGYDVDSMTEASQLATVVRLRDHVAGRKATAVMMMSLVTMGVAHDRITGDGFYDQQKQQSRINNSNWKPRSVKGLDGKYYSWSGILPPGLENWMAGWITALDNFDSLGEQNMENLHKKFAFVLGGAFMDDAGLSVIEPLVQIANGNNGSFQRWAAHQLNSSAPLAGARRDLSNLIDSGLKMIEPTIADNLKNRNRFAASGEELPQITNPLDGTQPNNYGFLQRLINKISPVKVHTGPSELGQFLHDIEYPSSMLFRTYKGVRLTGEERAQLQQIAWEQKIWRDGVRRAKRFADARGTIASLKEAQARGMTSDEILIGEFDGIHGMVDDAKEAAEEAAFNALPGDVQMNIITRLQEQERQKLKSQTGNILEQTPTR